MPSTLVALSGMLAAAAPVRATTAPIAVEISFVTHVGEGAEGQQRFTRDGCYQIESGGSTGGSTHAHASRAGCQRAADVAPIFARLDAIGEDRLVREGAKAGGADAGAPARRSRPGVSETQVVLIRADGSRWRAGNQATDDDIQRAVNELPTEIQSAAKPPEPPAGKGPQLVVLSSQTHGHLETRSAGLASDGRWWCDRNVLGVHQASRLPAHRAVPVTDAAARLRRIFTGSPPAPEDPEKPARPEKPAKEYADVDVDVAWPGQALGRLRPGWLKDPVTKRFSAEMASQSPACDLR